MNWKLKIRFRIASLFVYIWSRWFMRLFSLLNRRFREKQYCAMPEKSSWLPQHVLEFFKSCKWVADPLGGKWDYISKPEKFYLTRTGDCDDWSCFANAMLIKQSQIMFVSWMEANGKFNGHAVCLYKDVAGQYMHISNWGIRGPFDTMEAVVASITPSGAHPMVYSLRDRNLKCQICHLI